MGPASGVYYIRNISTKYYLAAAGQSGDCVSLSLTEPARFIVNESGGLYTVTLQSGSGLSVGLAPPGIAGDSLKWQRNPYQWNIIPLAPGIWNIRVPADALYWFDTMSRPTNVTVNPDNTADQNNWRFIAA